MVQRRRRCDARRGGRSRRRHPRPLPRPAHSVPQPLASLRGRRRRPQGRARCALGLRRRARARRSISPWSACCSTPAPDRNGTISRPAAGSVQPVGGAGAWRAGTPSAAVCFPATRHGHCWSTPQVCAVSPWSDWPRRSRCTAANPLVGSGGPRVAAAPARRGAVLPKVRRPARRLVRPHRRKRGSPHTTSCRKCWRRCRVSGWRPTRIGGPRARGLLAPRRGTRTRPDPRLGAVPQVVAMADLLATGTVRMGRRACVRAWTR